VLSKAAKYTLFAGKIRPSMAADGFSSNAVIPSVCSRAFDSILPRENLSGFLGLPYGKSQKLALRVGELLTILFVKLQPYTLYT